MSSLDQEIFDAPGYSARLSVTNDEVADIRNVIEEHWLSRIDTIYPELTQDFKSLGIARYHELSNKVDHNKLWQKRYRVLPPDAVKKIQKFDFYTNLLEKLSALGISDVVFENGNVQHGYGEIYWRLVRPSVSTDVGPLHADKWFHAVIGGDKGMFPEDTTTVKMWMPIVCESGKNGLALVPNSHNKIWNVKYIHDGVAPKPHFDDELGEYKQKLIPTEPGNILLFNENLLHCGVINQGDTTRVSIEITFIRSSKS